MPCGPDLIESVFQYLILCKDGVTPTGIRSHFGEVLKEQPTTRAIRYAIAELIKTGRAKRTGTQGPVYAVSDGDQA